MYMIAQFMSFCKPGVTPNNMTTNNAGWTRGWFYLRNFGNRLPAFPNKVLRERPEKWD